jgi:glutathione S-transferase
MKMCEPVRKSTRPVAPDGFVAPEPHISFPGPSLMWRIGPALLANICRAGTGKFVMGYTVRSTNGKLVEASTVLPDTCPPRPLVLYEVETSAACRKIREALCLLDLDVIVRPCPVGGTVFREYLTTKLGTLRLPYLVDPNSGFAEHDVTKIINYLFATYGGDLSSAPFVLGPVGGITANLQKVTSRGRGLRREESVVPAPKPLEMYAYEASPFCRLVRERLCELEISYILHTTSHGSKKRSALTKLAGRVQVPFLVDPNTGVAMFESEAIVDYLTNVYGPDAPGAVKNPESVYLERDEEWASDAGEP